MDNNNQSPFGQQQQGYGEQPDQNGYNGGQQPAQQQPGNAFWQNQQSNQQNQPQPAQPSAFGQNQPAWMNQPAQPQYGQMPGYPMQNGMGMPPQNNVGKKKLVLISAVGLFVLLAGSSAAAYFGYLVPNKPENIWASSLEQTAKAYDALITKADSKKDLTSYKFSGNYKLTAGVVSDGTFEGQSDANNLTMKADIGAVTTRIKLDMRMIDSPNSANPDMYIKASGLKGFGSLLGDTTGQLNAFENQWFEIDHTLLDTFTNAAGVDSDTATLSAEDQMAVSKAIGEVNREYLLSTDPSKRVLVLAQSQGKEKQDDRSVYKYKVVLDKEHTKAYVKAMVQKLDESPLKKMFGDKKLEEALNFKVDDMLKEIDKYDTKYYADVYVDLTTKLIRTVRFTDPDDTDSYLEVKMPFTGGDVLPLNVTFKGREDKKSDPLATLSMTLSSNMATNVTDVALKVDMPASSGSEAFKMTASVKVTAGKDKVTVEKPSGAKSLNELLGGLLGGFESSGGSELFGGGDTAI